jgi:hypothetical protein
MKKYFVWHSLLCLTLLLLQGKMFAQTDDTYHPFDFNLTVKNMHLWRGYKVTSAPVTAGDVYFISKDKSFKAGLWGGAGFTGEYREFDYYISYAKKGFSIAVWDINNFSGRDNVSIFDYNAATTSHFIDVTVAYQFQGKLPLKLSWSTIVLGRDFYLDNGGNAKNRFSNYVQAEMPVYIKDDLKLSAFLGGAFAFGRQDHFYGAHPNIVNAGITLSKVVPVLGFKIPVSATGMWNPEQKYGALQVAVQLF